MLGIVGFMASSDLTRHAMWAAALALALLVGLIATATYRRRRLQSSAVDVMSQFIAKDVSASFVANAEGEIQSHNAAADARFNDDVRDNLASTLRKTFANPTALLFRLQTRAASEGASREDLVTRAGHVRLSVHQMSPDAYLWRLEDIGDAANQGSYGPTLSMVLAGRTDAVLYMNGSARKLFGGRFKTLDQMFNVLPLVDGVVCEFNGTDGPERALISIVDAGAGRRAIYLLPPGPQNAVEQGWNAFQDLPVPLVRVCAEGTVQSFNRMAANLLGRSLRDDVHLSDLMEGLGRSISDWITDALAGRSSQTSEFLRLKRTDKEVYVQVTLNRVVEDGQDSLIAVLNDATELKSLEAQFVQSQKMQAIGQLAGGVAHDFNNLLTAISGHCDLLLLRHDQGDPDYSDLIQINQNANRAASLVGQLLAFSRKQTLRPETLDMRDTLADLTHLLNRLVGEKVTLTLNHDPVLRPIRADKRQLEQVLMNLVVNARDAMPEGGEIKISTECLDMADPLERNNVTVPKGKYVTVCVADTGAGIPPDKLQKVFEPFYTTKRTGEGTGLGLSTAYGIVKQTGGYIFVDSIVGSGTTFSLYFPVLEDAQTVAAAPKTPAVRSATQHNGGVILLVEDEAPVRAFASRALQLRGYSVLEASSAEAALKMLEDQDLCIDCFVTDVVMPGMDGPSWVREALKTRPDVRVVFVSGYAEDSFAEAQMKIANSVFLPKPFSLGELTDTVHSQLN
ncbi:MAG: ATP-binding protein [Sulfitobacter sp.]